MKGWDNMTFDVDKDMQPNKVEILPLVKLKDGKTVLDFKALEQLTSKEFVGDVKEEFEHDMKLSAFTCEVKKVIRSHRGDDYCDDIYVLIGHYIYSHIYRFPLNSKRGYKRDQDVTILNHNYYMEVIEPFMKKVDKNIIWKKRK